MKLCIAGNNNIAVDSLYIAISLLDKKKICVVLNKSDHLRNTWQKSLGFYAKKENIEIKVLEDLFEIEELIFISLQFDRIIKPKLFKTQRLFNIHFSLLPEYKGMYPSILPILHGKKYSGVTLHKIDKGIDTGDIIDQIKIDISGDTSQELYFKYLEHGTNIIRKNFDNLLNNNNFHKQQSRFNSTYFSKTSFNFKDVEINPFQTAYQINQFIKALNFRIYQLSKFKGQEIYKGQITERKSIEKPGTIISENIKKIEIATIDFNIILFKDHFGNLLDCCKTDNVKNAKEFIDFIHDFETIDKNGWTPLIIASFNGSIEMVKLLIKYGANVNGTNLNGTTILMYAKDSFLKTKNLSIIKILIENKANISAKDIYGKRINDYTQNSILIKHLKV